MDAPDLVVTYQPVPNGQSFMLYGYAGNNNSKVIAQTQNKSPADLRWFSSGIPRFIKDTTGKIYDIKENTFILYIECLNGLQREALARQAHAQYKDKVGGEIKIDQIHLVQLDYFTGIIRLPYENKKERIFQGEAISPIKASPFRLEFQVENNADLELLTKAVTSPQGISVLCRYGFAGYQEKTNRLTVTQQQLQEYGISNEVVGEAKQAYLTRKQCGGLAVRLYSELNILEEYEIDESKFSEGFIKEFITKSSQQEFVPVDFMKVLSEISNFMLPTLQKDLTADTIASDMGKIFTIEKKDTKEFLKLNKDILDKGKTWRDIKGSGSASADVLDILGAEASFNYAQSKSDEWEKQNKDFKEQLNELNTHKQNDIQWERKGETIVPKSVNVVLFTKAQFNRNFSFNRIRRVKKEARIVDTVKLYTASDVGVTPFVDRETQMVKELTDLQKQSDLQREQMANQGKQLKSDIVAMIPAGTIAAYWGNTIPSGWLLCNGQAVPSGSEYNALRSLVGTNVPDLRGVFLRGLDSGRGFDPGRGFGSYQEDAFQGHAHAYQRSYSPSSGSTPGGPTSLHYSNQGATTSHAISDGPNADPRFTNETRPKNIAVNYIIKY